MAAVKSVVFLVQLGLIIQGNCRSPLDFVVSQYLIWSHQHIAEVSNIFQKN